MAGRDGVSMNDELSPEIAEFAIYELMNQVGTTSATSVKARFKGKSS
jgi:hypothetical protein